MIEQFIFNKITTDDTLSTLLDNGSDGFNLFPGAVPRGSSIDKAITFTTISTLDAYPNINSINVQFNMFASKHQDISAMGLALKNLFNQKTVDQSGGVIVIGSKRAGENDFGYNYDDKTYQRQATYYFKIG